MERVDFVKIVYEVKKREIEERKGRRDAAFFFGLFRRCSILVYKKEIKSFYIPIGVCW